MEKKVLIQEAVFDPGEESLVLAAHSSRTGAVVTFIGLVRDINEDDQVASLYLEHYPGMTEKSIDLILDEAAGRWDLLGASVIHRVGLLRPCDPIVFVGTCSSHRQDAFDSCAFIMDYLKTRAPFWKKEATPEGERWLETRSSDFAAADTWRETE